MNREFGTELGELAMLILSRKNLEAVVVSDVSGFEPVLRITVLEVMGSRVKLGFEAAKEVTIHRAEVWERLRVETEASEPSPDVALPRYLDPYLD
jgi:carbon storage regulator